MNNTPQFMTIREVAKTNILSEHALRLMLNTKKSRLNARRFSVSMTEQQERKLTLQQLNC